MTTTTGLLHVIERYAHEDSQLQTKLTSEKRIYSDDESDLDLEDKLLWMNEIQSCQVTFITCKL